MLAAKCVMKVCETCGILMTTQVRDSDPGSRKALERWKKSKEKTSPLLDKCHTQNRPFNFCFALDYSLKETTSFRKTQREDQ